MKIDTKQFKGLMKAGLTAVTPATWKAEIGGIEVQSQTKQKS
jgi:hypothetical protein